MKDRVGNIQFASTTSTAFVPAKETTSNAMRPPTLIPAFSNAKVFPVVGPDGIVKLAQCGDTSPISVATQPPSLAIGNPAYAAATSLAGSLSNLNRATISSAHMQRLNPVAATLALLGIQTPLRPHDQAETSPIEQYRQIVATDTSTVQSSPELLVQPTAAMNSLSERSPDALLRGQPYDDMATRGAALLTRSLSSSIGSPRPNKTHPN